MKVSGDAWKQRQQSNTATQDRIDHTHTGEAGHAAAIPHALFCPPVCGCVCRSQISLLKLVALAACVVGSMAGTIVPKGYSADASAAPASAMVDAKMPGVVGAAHQLGSFWDKVKHDAEEAAKHLAEEEAKKIAEELAEKALEAAAAALLGATHRPVLAPTADDLERVKIVHTVNAAKTTWTAGLNSRFLGRPLSAVKRQLGVKSVKKLPERERFVVSPDALPTNFDSRTQWPNCKTIQEVRDQSDCGSCWAFGAVEAASDRICIDTNGADQAHLSAEDMVGCCSACGYGCDGGDPGSAWEYLASTGIVTGGNYNDYSWCSAYSLPNCQYNRAQRRQSSALARTA